MRWAPSSILERAAEYGIVGGVVDANGNPRLKVGDRVFGSIPMGGSFRSGQGALAQYASVPAGTTTSAGGYFAERGK